MHVALMLAGLALSAPPQVLAPGTGPVDPEIASMLRTWDEARARSYTRGSEAALQSLYADRATAAPDVAILRAYQQRDLRVWLRTQVFEVHLVSTQGGQRRVRVVDRTVTAVAGDGTCRRLPDSRPRSRVVGFVNRDGRWVVGSVRFAVR